MVEHTCTRCGKSFPKLWKLRRHNERQYKCRPKATSTSEHIPEQVFIPQITDQEGVQEDIPRPRSPSPVPVVHIRERDRRMEKPKAVIPTSERAGSIAPIKEQEGEYIDRHARKSGEHLRTWGARLR